MIIRSELVKFMARHVDWECCVALYPVQPLPPASTIHIQVGPNIPSLSGPLRNQKKYQFSFLTLAKFCVDSFAPDSSPKHRVHEGWIGKIKFNDNVCLSPSLVSSPLAFLLIQVIHYAFRWMSTACMNLKQLQSPLFYPSSGV